MLLLRFVAWRFALPPGNVQDVGGLKDPGESNTPPAESGTKINARVRKCCLASLSVLFDV